jgi:hypothetical protein
VLLLLRGFFARHKHACRGTDVFPSRDCHRKTGLAAGPATLAGRMGYILAPTRVIHEKLP